MLPNGMVGHAAIHSIAQNDRGLVNLTGIEEYLHDVLQGQQLGNSLLFPALFGDKLQTDNSRTTCVVQLSPLSITI